MTKPKLWAIIMAGGSGAGLPQIFSASAARGSRAPSGAKKSEAVGLSDSTAGGRPEGGQEAAEGRRSEPLHA